MGKKETFARPRKSSKESFAHLEKHDPTKGLKDSKAVLDALVECLKQNDLESFEDILIAHLRVSSKSQLSKKAGLGRQTIYDLLQGKRGFNPTLRTIGSLFKALAA